MTFIHTIDEFKQNLVNRFSSSAWLEAIDFSKLVIVGGCVLNALCQVPFLDTKQQDINLIYYSNDAFEFENTMRATVDRLNGMLSASVKNQIKLESIPGTDRHNVFLPCNVTLNFSCPYVSNSKKPLSHILHNFDMDICQVAFTGKFLFPEIKFESIKAITNELFRRSNHVHVSILTSSFNEISYRLYLTCSNSKACMYTHSKILQERI